LLDEKSDDTVHLNAADLDWVRRFVKRDQELFWDLVRSIAERDLALFWNGEEGPLMDSLSNITMKETRSELEEIYLHTVLAE
jgi:hypothetical protein